MNNKKKIIIGGIIALFIIVIGVSVVNNLVQKSDINENKISKNTYILSEFEQEVANALISDDLSSYYSIDDVVGAGCPPGYIFLSSGKFSYNNTGEYSPVEEGQILSYRGNWKILCNKLILNVSEVKIACGGIIIEDAIEGKILKEYTEVIQNTSKTYEYELDKINSDEIGRTYLTFKNTNIHLTRLLVSNSEFLDNMIKVANEGY